MNILFLLKSFEIGGLEVVTSVLANKFVIEGHNVVIWAFFEGKTSLKDRLDSRVDLMYGNGFNSGKQNVKSLRDVLTDNKIQVVINQWGLPFIPAYTLKKAAKGLNVKIIAVYHNDPSSNGRTKEVEIALERCDNPLKRAFLKMKLYAFKQITAASMRYIYKNSDRFMVLSESFIKHFEDFTGIRHANKLIVQTNPITIDTEHYELDLSKKQKEIVYVGRIDNQQKRTSRVIETWALLEDKHPDWILRIVGDGEERKNLEQLSRDLNLKRVVFEGFRQPSEYYKRASILILTSEYEGFGLVIVEGMSFGVVPVVLGSYSAIYDILKNRDNGIIVSYDKQAGFHAEEMAKEISWLIEHNAERERMAHNAYESSRNFSLDKIATNWQSTLNKLSGGGKNAVSLKEKEVIYVGRLDYNQKRVHRIIETWALIEDCFPDWRLTLVGDGVERDNLEHLAETLNLCHVNFEGFADPRPYYERASILLLTSEFEGFPLVLAECMSFGVVPVVYGSYSAVYDIIRNGENGMILEPQSIGFSTLAMSEAIKIVMEDDIKRCKMAGQAMQTSRNYSIDTIYRQWEKVFSSI